MNQVEFKIIKSEDIKFGTNNFIEVGIRARIDGDSEHEFISLGRGYYNKTGNKKYKCSITLPNDKEILIRIAEAIKSIKS